MYLFKIYFKYIAMYMKTEVEYKASFFISFISNILDSYITFIGMWIIMNNVTSINGWSFNEFSFFYSLYILSQGLSGMFFWKQAVSMEDLIRTGKFDILMIRTIKPLTHLLINFFSYAHLAWVTVAFVFLIRSIIVLKIKITIITLFFLIGTIIGGLLINGAILIICGAMGFWIVKVQNLVRFIHQNDGGVKVFIEYPVSIYPRVIQILLTFIIPYAFINYYPSMYFFNKYDQTIFNPIISLLTPVVGIILMIIAIQFFNFAVKKYQSAG